MIKRHRIFIAINLPFDIKKRLSDSQKKWPNLPARWIKSDNLHITLAFLGYLTDGELGEVCITVKKVAERHSPFEINLNKIAYGPVGEKSPRPPKFLNNSEHQIKQENTNQKFGRPRMVWINGKRSKDLSDLKVDLENILSESIRFKPEKRSFNIHITLARLKQLEFKSLELEERPEIDENIDLTFAVESIDVMESVLRRTGPQYTILESFDLKNET